MLNQVIQMGRITADPELKQTQSGVSFLNFSIAVEKDYVGENGKRDVDFFDVTAWRGTAEFIARNFSKGRLITIVGSLENQKWTDNAGNNRTNTRIKAEQAYFCGDFGERRETQAQPAQPQTAPPTLIPPSQRCQQQQMPYNPCDAPTPPPPSDDDLPF